MFKPIAKLRAYRLVMISRRRTPANQCKRDGRSSTGGAVTLRVAEGGFLCVLQGRDRRGWRVGQGWVCHLGPLLFGLIKHFV